jgi:hypothetical protein
MHGSETSENLAVTETDRSNSFVEAIAAAAILLSALVGKALRHAHKSDGKVLTNRILGQHWLP